HQPDSFNLQPREVNDVIIEEGNNIPLHDANRALMHVRAKAARVVEVVMSVDDVLDPLVGNELLDFGNDRQGTGLVKRRLDNSNEVAKFDSQTVVSTTRQIEDSFGQPLGLHANRWESCRLDRLWNSDRVPARIRLDIADGDTKRIVASIRDAEVPLRPFFMVPVRVVMKIGWKLHTTKLLVGAVGFFLDR